MFTVLDAVYYVCTSLRDLCVSLRVFERQVDVFRLSGKRRKSCGKFERCSARRGEGRFKREIVVPLVAKSDGTKSDI